MQTHSKQSRPDATFQVVAAPLRPAQAPADRYFGLYRLSNLSIRNAIHDMTIEGNSPLALPLQVGRIDAVTSALGDWANEYPKDPWLPSTIVRFETFLHSKQEPQYDRQALSLLYFLTSHFPGTWYAKYARLHLEAFDLLPNLDLAAAADTPVIVRNFPAIRGRWR
jgi:hypothetical protein